MNRDVNYMIRCVTLLFGCVLFLSANSAFAAKVQIAPNMSNIPRIFISGKIVKGDLNKIIQTTKEFLSSPLFGIYEDYQLDYLLNSKGGNVREAIKIGRFFNKILAEVTVMGNTLINDESDGANYVTEHRFANSEYQIFTQNTVIYDSVSSISQQALKKCYSACVLMLLGAVEIHVVNNYIKYNGLTIKEIPVIGLHRPYFYRAFYSDLPPDKARKLYHTMSVNVRSYLADVGASEQLIEKIFGTSSNKVDLVGREVFYSMLDRISPFYQEWIIAKCGMTAGRNAIPRADLAYYKKIHELKDKKVDKILINRGIKPGDNNYLDVFTDVYNDIYNSYIPDGYSRERYRNILSRIQHINVTNSQCKYTATARYQMKVISSY